MTNLKVSPQTTDKSSVSAEDMKGFDDEFSIPTLDTDGPSDIETTFIPDFKKWHGYYRTIPEFQAVINKLASWTFGRGIIADKKNEEKLKKLKGFGKDTPRSILKNLWRTALICGDSFAEEIRDKQGRITNLKPLNPATIKIIADKYGIIKKYEQINTKITYNPDEIFHLSYERIADEIHGIPFGEKIEDLILMRNEAMADQKIVFHRYVKPLQVISVDTDDEGELNTIQSKFDDAYKKTENIIVPKGKVEGIERIAIPQYATLDPLNWLKYLVRQFVTACGVPEVVMGWGADTTEASSKVIYLAFQQEIEDMQLYIKEQIEAQLGIKINLEFPASLEKELIEDQKKDSGQLKETNLNPNKDG